MGPVKIEKNLFYIIIFLLEGVCYGFQVMQTNESPDVPFTIFRTRFKTGMLKLCYNSRPFIHLLIIHHSFFSCLSPSYGESI